MCCFLHVAENTTRRYLFKMHINMSDVKLNRRQVISLRLIYYTFNMFFFTFLIVGANVEL